MRAMVTSRCRDSVCKDEWSWKWEYFERCIKSRIALMSVLPTLTLHLALVPSSVYFQVSTCTDRACFVDMPQHSQIDIKIPGTSGHRQPTLTTTTKSSLSPRAPFRKTGSSTTVPHPTTIPSQLQPPKTYLTQSRKEI
jgi:hypothetical protein